MRTLLLLLLSALFCCGQGFTDIGFVGAVSDGYVASGAADPWENYPTNITGYPVVAWYPGDSYNGAGVWSDYGGVNTFNLTNSANYPTTETNNAHKIAVFSGSSQWLKCLSYTNRVVNEFVILMYPQMDDSTANNRILTITDGTPVFRRNATTFVPYFFAAVGLTAIPTNTWVVYNITNAANTTSLYTNTVYSASSGSPVNQAMGGMAVGGRYSDGAAGAKMKVAEIIVYNTNLTEAIRSNLFHYLTNKYAVTP